MFIIAIKFKKYYCFCINTAMMVFNFFTTKQQLYIATVNFFSKKKSMNFAPTILGQRE